MDGPEVGHVRRPMTSGTEPSHSPNSSLFPRSARSRGSRAPRDHSSGSLNPPSGRSSLASPSRAAVRSTGRPGRKQEWRLAGQQSDALDVLRHRRQAAHPRIRQPSRCASGPPFPRRGCARRRFLPDQPVVLSGHLDDADAVESRLPHVRHPELDDGTGAELARDHEPPRPAARRPPASSRASPVRMPEGDGARDGPASSGCHPAYLGDDRYDSCRWTGSTMRRDHCMTPNDFHLHRRAEEMSGVSG